MAERVKRRIFLVFPAYAGVNLIGIPQGIQRICIPRVCGGEPI